MVGADGFSAGGDCGVVEKIVTATLEDGNSVGVQVTAASSDELASVGLRDGVAGLDDALKQVSSLAASVQHHLERLAPSRTSVEFGIAFTVTAGHLTALLVNGKSDMSMKLTLEWDRTSTHKSD
jgi:hypothetical protein